MSGLIFRTILIATASCAAIAAEAATFQVDTKASSGTIQTSGPSDNKFQSGSAPLSLTSSSVTDSSGTARAIGTALAVASAAPGVVKSYSLATGDAFAVTCCTSAGGTGSSWAKVEDRFVLASPFFAGGTIASISAAVLIDGMMTSLDQGGFWSGQQSWTATAQIGSTSWTWSGSRQGNATNGITTMGDMFGLRPIMANVTVGQETLVMLRVETVARADAGGFGPNSARWETNLGNSLTWRGIGAMSVGGMQVSDFSALSSSTGFDYRAGIIDADPPAPGIPEPQSWALLLSGFGVLGMAVRRQRRCHDMRV